MTARRSILVVSQLPPPLHGSTVMTRYLLAALEASGRSTRLVDRRFSRTAHAVGRPTAAKALAAPLLVVRLIVAVASSRPDRCIFFLTNRPGSFLVDRALLTALRALRVPVVLYVHTSGYRALASRGPFWRHLVRTAVGGHEVVVLGETLVDDLLPFTERDRISIVPNMAEPPQAVRSDAERAQSLHVVHLSNLDPEKGADAFIRLAGRVASSTPSRFSLAGAGSDARMNELRSSIDDSNAPVELLGALGTSDKWSLLQSADVLVFPSTYRYEAQPLTIIEAMSLGVPVVAYDVGGVRDVVLDGRTGRLAAPGDEDALMEAVLQLSDAGERARIGRQARERFLSAHSADAYRASWEALLP